MKFSVAVPEKGILYAHVSMPNKDYLHSQAKKQKVHLSTYMDKLISQLRDNGTI